MPDLTPPAPAGDEQRYTWAIFRSVNAIQPEHVALTLAEMAARVRAENRDDDDVEKAKKRLPLHKLAQFNGPRSNAHLDRLTGIIADYDGGVMSLAEAAERLDKAGVSGLLYTTSRHAIAAPRWHCCLPFSEPLPPSEHGRMVDRLNGILDGALSSESWTLSQAYFFGSVNSNPEHEAVVVDGLSTIDRADELDAIAIGKPESRLNGGQPKPNGAGAGEHIPSVPEAEIGDIAAAVALIPNDDVEWEGWNHTGMAMFAASAGSEAGFALFDEWSSRSKKYDAAVTATRWKHWFRSPPTQLGYGTLVFLARETDPDFEPPSRNARRFTGAPEAPEAPGASEAPETPPDTSEAPNTHQAPPQTPARLVIYDAGLRRDLPPPRAWLLGVIFCRKFLSLLIAGGGVGKSALRITQALSLATGRSFTGEHVWRRCRVLLLSFEDDLDELERRVGAAMAYHLVSHDEVAGYLFYASVGPRDGKIAELRYGKPARGALADLITEAVARTGADLVVFDPMVRTHSVGENDNNAVDFVVAILTALAVDRDIAVDLVHHAHKGTPEPGNADMARGASALINAARLAYTLTAMSAEEAERFGIRGDERRRYVRLDNAKTNLCPPGAATWFHLVGVKLGNVTSDYPNGDEVQVAELWFPPDSLDGMPRELVEQILDAIDHGLPGVLGDQLYSSHGAAKERAAWRVVQRFCPDKTDQQCRDLVKRWLKEGRLIEVEHRDPEQRRDSRGLRRG